MKNCKQLKTIAIVGATLVAGPVMAQSSVTLYGIVDDAVLYQSSSAALGSNAGGKSNVQLSSGFWAGSRFGFKGTEDLGGGVRTLFQLENGFSTNSGAALQGGLEFGRIASVGISSGKYGTLTAGRQYSPYLTLLSPYAQGKWMTIHPGDIDAFDYTFHTNNSLVYISPKVLGFTVGGSYAIAGIPGSINRGSTWSAAIQYAAGPLGVGAAIWRINNSALGGGPFGTDSTTISGTQTGVSALTNGYQTAQAQQRFAVVSTYAFSSTWDVSLSYSNVQYIPGSGSKFRDTATFNTAGAVLHWKPTAAWDLATGYVYTRATQANGISSAAQYQQANLTEYYALSKRTGLYGFQAYQRANGKTLGTNGAGNVINATPAIGDWFQASPSSSRSQVALSLGIIHRF